MITFRLHPAVIAGEKSTQGILLFFKEGFSFFSYLAKSGKAYN